MTRTIQKLLPIVSVDPDQELIEYLETVLEVPGEHLMVPDQDQREALQTEAVVMAQDQPEVQAMEMAQVMVLLVIPQAEVQTVGLAQMAQALTVVIAAAVLALVMVADQATVEMAVTMALSLTLLL